jgi:dynein intermediate chain 2
MAAIGDAEGTISIMNLSRPLVETSAKEKEVMQSIFEREFRREKNLEVQRKGDKGAEKSTKKAHDPAKAQQEKDEKMALVLEE